MLSGGNWQRVALGDIDLGGAKKTGGYEVQYVHKSDEQQTQSRYQ